MELDKFNIISDNELRDFLKKKLKKDLLDVARELKIKKLYSMKKEELINKIIEVEKAKQIPYADNAITNKIDQDSKPSSLEFTKNSKSNGHKKKFETVELKTFEEPKYPGERFEIPHKYNETKIVAMVRDPKCIFVYWDINSEQYKMFDLDSKKLFLKLYDITGVDFDGSNENSHSTIELIENVENWYINLSESNRDYCVEIGFFNENGQFISIARSNIVAVPRSEFSDSYDDHWMSVEELIEVSISDRKSMAINSSFEIEKMISERLRTALSSESLVTSGAISSLAASKF